LDNISQKDIAKNMRNYLQYNKKSGFSMLELVFVIIVLGILASFAMPRFDRDLRQDAADTILSNIRYAQNMAMNDYRHNADDIKWQKSFWQFSVEGCSDDGVFLRVGSDGDYEGDISLAEAAIDPANGLPMFWQNYDDCEGGGDGNVSPSIFLTKRFGVRLMTGTGGCNNVKRIFFDHLGRPHVRVNDGTTPFYGSYMSTECVFEFEFTQDEESVKIHILPETGYAFIEDQNRS